MRIYQNGLRGAGRKQIYMITSCYNRAEVILLINFGQQMLQNYSNVILKIKQINSYERTYVLYKEQNIK